MQYNTLHYNALHCITLHYMFTLHYITWHYITLHTYVSIYILACLWKYVGMRNILHSILVYIISHCAVLCSITGTLVQTKYYLISCYFFRYVILWFMEF